MEAPLLDALTADPPAAAVPWLGQARAAALAALRRDGLPDTRVEAWKYTSLRALAQRRLLRDDAGAATRPVGAQALDGIDAQAPRMVFVNGRFRADLSRLPDLAGLTLRSLADTLVHDPEAVRAAFAQRDGGVAEAFARLNTAAAADGAVLHVAAGVQVSAPLQIVWIGAPAEADLAWHARMLIELEAGAALTLVEHHVADAAHAHLGNLLVRCVVGAGATLAWATLQDAAPGSSLIRRSEATLAEAAQLRLHTLETGAQFVRHDLAVDLAGDGARLVSRGVFALRGRQHADTHLDVRHLARDTACDLVWRGVADERSRGVFHGAITIAPGADGSDAQLSNKNLLLSPNAEIDTQPVLEIHADEVKAAHGATVGQLDERALFYLRSRGIPAEDARTLLTQAFCAAVFADVEPVALRERLLARLGGPDGALA
ncbi:MAG TPA: Fe-S cluster assembly protein SufD [Dokdonella sp.]|uniref:Fe-S cluster assembly protein SufD n=1 Tax=Dokdonella sp. TaxID=2291710 RepID=UPI002B570C1B|nr:Fe-S cluster assembly protein SufD [Dokdonella sp.]HUD40455.1 Fe-S cluster assembly protein SufD [Dokdonella sp.]